MFSKDKKRMSLMSTGEVFINRFSLCMSINTTLIVGVLRSGGDTEYGLAVDQESDQGKI